MSDPLPPFDSARTFSFAQPPLPEWKPGNGAKIPDEIEEEEVVTMDASQLNPNDNYKLLIGGVVPRPIAFASTIDQSTGKVNVAPFSFFNALGQDPPTVMISVSRPGGNLKDTGKNVIESKEFVVNIISEWFADAANYASIDAPHEVSEFELAGLTPVPSQKVAPPRVKESAFSMECRLLHHYPAISPRTGRATYDVFIGEVVMYHVRQSVLNPSFKEPGAPVIDYAKLKPVSRLGGIGYGRLTEGYELKRPVWKVEKERFEGKGKEEEK